MISVQKKITPKIIPLLHFIKQFCIYLAIFFSFLLPLYALCLKCILNQLYHLSGSLTNELNKSLACT